MEGRVSNSFKVSLGVRARANARGNFLICGGNQT